MQNKMWEQSNFSLSLSGKTAQDERQLSEEGARKSGSAGIHPRLSLCGMGTRAGIHELGNAKASPLDTFKEWRI